MTATVTALRPPRETARGEWVRAVTAAVRAEFRVEVLEPAPDDMVLFGPGCSVEGCRGSGNRRTDPLCPAHQRQFNKRGNGRSVSDWVGADQADGGPRELVHLRRPQPCRVGGCPRSSVSVGMCGSHWLCWLKSGRPPVEAFVATVPVAIGDRAPHPPGSCAVPACGFARMPNREMCDAHHHRFTYHRAQHGITLEAFLRDEHLKSTTGYDLSRVPEPLRAEVQFTLQSLSDERGRRVTRSQVMRCVWALGAHGLRSVLNAEPATVPQLGGDAAAFLRLARDRCDRLADKLYGREEWDRDEWRVDRLPIARPPGPSAKILSFTFCESSWLQDVLKRWVRWRLNCGLGLSTAEWNLRGVRHFVEFCQATGRPLDRPEDVTRELLEAWLAEIAGRNVTAGTRNRWMGSLRLFLDDVRRHDWAPIALTATYHRGEFAKRPEDLPRFLEEHVIARMERDDALERLPTITTRTLVHVLIETGLRAVDARTLPLDALSADGAGAAYLRYFNHKLNRERWLPISPRLADRIRTQQAWVREHFGDDATLLPAERRNADGRRPFTYGTLNHRLRAWTRELDLRDSNGAPVEVTPHRLRHTLATRMVNQGIPQIVVQQMLDHDSPRMTNVYARLHDQTLREHFDRFHQRINIRGELVETPEGPLADAVWAKENLARAKQSLPNGFCGLPLQQSCPHPNACLSCDHFLTSPEFLPVHREQLERTRTLLGEARERGQQRLVEMNEPVEVNLVRIIEGLDALGEEPKVDAA
jgi:site-specific recombinase XerD